MISLIHPSRGRPKLAKQARDEWLSKASTKEIEYILTLDDNDPTINEYKKWGKPYVSGTRNCVEATNYAASLSFGDILIYLSDDFSCPDNWDQLILDEAEKQYDKFLIWVNDGIQKGRPVVTIPIMSRGLYEELGYLYHPAYKSMWVDVDLYYTVKQKGYLVDCQHLLFPHNHYSVGKAQRDKTYQEHDNKLRQDEGKRIFNKRSIENKWGKRF